MDLDLDEPIFNFNFSKNQTHTNLNTVFEFGSQVSELPAKLTPVADYEYAIKPSAKIRVASDEDMNPRPNKMRKINEGKDDDERTVSYVTKRHKDEFVKYVQTYPEGDGIICLHCLQQGKIPIEKIDAKSIMTDAVVYKGFQKWARVYYPNVIPFDTKKAK